MADDDREAILGTQGEITQAEIRDWENNWKENFRCENSECSNPDVEFLSDEKNHSIRKVCFSCFSSRAIKKTQLTLGLVTDSFDKFRAFRDNHYAELRLRAREKFSNWVNSQSDQDFYRSPQWRRVRFDALLACGRQCLACGRAAPAVILHVDHIRPRSKHPELALELSNLQVLCEDCNLGKSNIHVVDFRPIETWANRPMTKDEIKAMEGGDSKSGGSTPLSVGANRSDDDGGAA